MTRDEVLRIANERLQAIIDRVRGEVAEVERQRGAALAGVPGVSAVLQQFQADCDHAAADRRRTIASAEAALATVVKDAADERYAAVGSLLTTVQAGKSEADRKRQEAVRRAEDEYSAATGAADGLAGSAAAKDATRRDAKARRDAAVRDADRAYAQAVDAADRRYVADYSAAHLKEADVIEGARRLAADDKAAAEVAYAEAIHLAEEARHERLSHLAPAAAVQEAFDARRAAVERRGEQDKAAVLAWMREQLATLGSL